VDKYTCERCKLEFETNSEWTEKQAAEEYLEMFGLNGKVAIVCDDCYAKILEGNAENN